MPNRDDFPLIDPLRAGEYHAHVYYTPPQRPHAAWLRAQLGRRFVVRLGRFRETPVGPHPRAMFQVAFVPAHFGAVVPFLMLNRGPLDILIHPESGHGHAGDHAVRSAWLGRPLVLDIPFLELIDAGHLPA